PTTPTGEPTTPTGEPTTPTGKPTTPTGGLTTPTGELTTPTGAALLTVLASGFASEPVLDRVTRIGYGFGTREMAWPNAVRILVGGQASPPALERDRVVEIQTNLDHA